MHKIEFVKEIMKPEFLNPEKKFRRDSQTIERRKDPLTGKWCRINLERIKRLHQEKKEKTRVEDFEKECFFCPKNVEKTTPKFPSWLIPEGRVKINEFMLFPNLFPFGEYHAVGVLCRKHSLRLHEITSRMWEDCLIGCIEFFRAIDEKNLDARFPSINLNYSPSAGASIIHPHVQVLVDKLPTVMADEYFRKSWMYFDRNRTNYWQDLIMEERKNGERFIGESKNMAWLTSFAPTCDDEIIGIMKGSVSSFLELNDEQIHDLGKSIWRVFRGLYRIKRTTSVNMSIFSAPLDEHLGHFFSLNVRIVSRPSSSTSDRGFFEILHREPVVSTSPEELAEELRKLF